MDILQSLVLSEPDQPMLEVWNKCSGEDNAYPRGEFLVLNDKNAAL
jgi:hypothetical protein